MKQTGDLEYRMPPPLQNPADPATDMALEYAEKRQSAAKKPERKRRTPKRLLLAAAVLAISPHLLGNAQDNVPGIVQNQNNGNYAEDNPGNPEENPGNVQGNPDNVQGTPGEMFEASAEEVEQALEKLAHSFPQADKTKYKLPRDCSGIQYAHYEDTLDDGTTATRYALIYLYHNALPEDYWDRVYHNDDRIGKTIDYDLADPLEWFTAEITRLGFDPDYVAFYDCIKDDHAHAGYHDAQGNSSERAELEYRYIYLKDLDEESGD